MGDCQQSSRLLPRISATNAILTANRGRATPPQRFGEAGASQRVQSPNFAMQITEVDLVAAPLYGTDRTCGGLTPRVSETQ